MATKNFAYSTVLTAPVTPTAGTSLVVQSGDGTKFYNGKAWVWPAGVQPLTSNAEIVNISGVSTDTLTIARTQESSTNRTILVGDQIAQGLTAAMFDALLDTGTAQTITSVKTFSTAPVISSITNTGTITLPTSTDTLVGKATTDTFTNKTFDTAGTGNVFKIAGTTVSSVTGTGSVNVLQTSPTLITPVLGVAAATTINKVTITAPATSATLTLVQGSTLATAGAFSTTLTATGTTTVTLPTTGTLATLAGSETFTNKILNMTNNTVSNITLAMFAANVADTDGTLAANVDTRVATQKAVKTYVDAKAALTSVVTNEVPGGLVNGSNTAYTTASAFATGSLEVWRNGIKLKAGGADYTAGSSAFTMVTAPITGDVLLINYLVGSSVFNVGTNSSIWNETPVGTVNGVTTLFTLARAYISGSLQVHVDGILQRITTDFTETTPGSGTFTFVTAPATGQSIRVHYQYNLNPSGNSDTVDGFHANATATANNILPLDSNAQVPTVALGAAWASWTPTLSSFTLGNGTMTAKYRQIGKVVIFRLVFTLGSTSAVGTNPNMSLPVTALAYGNTSTGNPTIGDTHFEDNGVATYLGHIDMPTTTTMRPLIYNVAGTYATAASLTSIIPFTWGTGDEIIMTGSYEAA